MVVAASFCLLCNVCTSRNSLTMGVKAGAYDKFN